MDWFRSTYRGFFAKAVELSYLPENEQVIVAESGSVVNEKSQRIRKACGKFFIIDVRLGSEDNPGNTLEDAVEVAKMCEEAGADMVNMSSGINLQVSNSPTQWAE